MKKDVLIVISAILLFLSHMESGLACDFCLLSQGISPLDTIKGAGIKVSERYTLLDQVYKGTGKQRTRVQRKIIGTELTGFYSITPEFMMMAVIPYKKRAVNSC